MTNLSFAQMPAPNERNGMHVHSPHPATLLPLWGNFLTHTTTTLRRRRHDDDTLLRATTYYVVRVVTVYVVVVVVVVSLFS
jgi:hypothetical protein